MTYNDIKVTTSGNILTKQYFLYEIEENRNEVYLNLEEQDFYTIKLWKLLTIVIVLSPILLLGSTTFIENEKDKKTRHLKIKLDGNISNNLIVTAHKDGSINLKGVDAYTVIEDKQKQSILLKKRIKLINKLVCIGLLMYIIILIILIFKY